jgi:hypothetical protein
VRIYSFDNSDSIESSIVLYLGSAAPFIPYFWRALVNARRKEEQKEEGVTMAASATGGGQSRELCRKLSLERRVASRRRRPRTLPLGRLRPPPPAEERSCATYTYIVKPRLIVARFHKGWASCPTLLFFTRLIPGTEAFDDLQFQPFIQEK